MIQNSKTLQKKETEKLESKHKVEDIEETQR